MDPNVRDFWNRTPVEQRRDRAVAGLDDIPPHLGKNKWYREAISIVSKYAETNEVLSVGLVRAVIIERIGPPVNSNIWGRMFLEAASQGIIEDSGRTERSSTPSRKGGKVTVWKSKKYKG
jgi:hypothetical protein